MLCRCKSRVTFFLAAQRYIPLFIVPRIHSGHMGHLYQMAPVQMSRSGHQSVFHRQGRGHGHGIDGDGQERRSPSSLPSWASRLGASHRRKRSGKFPKAPTFGVLVVTGWDRRSMRQRSGKVADRDTHDFVLDVRCGNLWC
jgi:hypothetical protein